MHVPIPSIAFGKERDILLVVGTGQEPRLGRWVSKLGNSSVNRAIVFALSRTYAQLPNGSAPNEDDGHRSEDDN